MGKVKIENIPYFAYGSNLNMEQMSRRCPDSKPLTKCKLYGARLVFKYYCDVIKTGNKNDFVEGALYNVSKSDILALDRYEGYPTFYTKKLVNVIDSKGNNIKAFIYVMTPGSRTYSLPNANYFETVLNGYNDWKLNTERLYKCLKENYIKGAAAI